MNDTTNQPPTTGDDQDDVFLITDDDNAELVFDPSTESSLPIEMATPSSNAWKILVVDDDPEIHTMTQIALRDFTYGGKPLELHSAYSGGEAKELIKDHPDTALILLDVVMEKNNSGLEVVRYVREELGNQLVRIILRTGQPGDVPEKSVIVNYTINDYKTKLELTHAKLFTTMIATLRSYQDVLTIQISLQKLEAQARALQEEIEERKRTEVQLQATLQEKEMLMREVHHRVKNNLQIISSMLELQAETTNNAAAREILQAGQNRIRAMALLHDQLYKNEDLSKVDFAEYIDTLTHHLREAFVNPAGAVALKSNSDPAFMRVEIAIPCGLIINELVTNALKHAFHEDEESHQSGEIDVELRLEGANKWTLQVKDNGIGLSPEVDFYQAKSVGLNMVTSLVEKIKGLIELQDEKGTAITITFTE